MSEPYDDNIDDLDINCEEPCPYGSACPRCESYWTRMEIEGYWKNGAWTNKGFKEMCK